MKTKAKITKTFRQQRVFSVEIKKQVVLDIERGNCSVSQAEKELGVCNQTIYNWINQYSRYLHSNKRLVVEDKSEAYRTRELEQRIRELEAALGRKQMELDLLNKVIDLADEEYQTDLKKSLSKKASNGSGSPKGSDINGK